MITFTTPAAVLITVIAFIAGAGFGSYYVWKKVFPQSK